MERRRTLWILGRGGFLGSTLSRKAPGFDFDLFTHHAIPWDTSTVRADRFHSISKEFAHFSEGAVATIIWAAGSQGVLDSSIRSASELESFHDFVNAISSVTQLHGSTVTIVSSAGGVYGGSSNPPFSIKSEVRAINQYGLDKIAIEEYSRKQLTQLFNVHISRLTNLYGPWAGPRQGLINRMCTAAATREALHIYVPLNTVRDYIHVTDAAELVLLEAIQKNALDQQYSMSLIGSGESSSVGQVIDTIAHVTHRKVPISIAEMPGTQLQPKDLRVSPSWHVSQADFSPIRLATGVKNLFDAIVAVPRWN